MSLVTSAAGLTLITGGAWSGKTKWVADQLANTSRVTWVGTALTDDEEMRAHIQSTRSTRPQSWKTLEASIKLPEVIASQSSESHILVVDSISMWLGNLTAQATSRYSPRQTRDILCDAGQELLESILLQQKHRCVITVTSEMGWGPPPSDAYAYELRRRLGYLNQNLASASKHVFVVQCGIGQKIKTS